MPRNNELPSYESLLEFQEVYTRAIALCWNDNGFKTALDNDPKSALENYLGYKCPWNVNLKFEFPKESESCKWDGSKWILPKNTWTFGVPTKPDDENIEPIALAAYHDAGPTYLFTCC